MDKLNFFSEDVSVHFTEEVTAFLKQQIQVYQGQEILFGGRIPSKTFPKVGECDILSRDNYEQVPLISKISQYHVIIHNHPSSYLTPSSGDLEVASTYADQAGFMIVDNDVEKVNVVVPIPQLSQDKVVDSELILRAFTPNGTLSEVLPEFEARHPQKKMVREVANAFNREQVLICEAETGTGKSLGYGIVAAHWVLLNKKKVVISTNTINLQEQLLNKDLPVIRECLRRETGRTPEIILVKGKNNYLCRSKFEEFKKETTDTLNLSLDKKINLLQRDEIFSWGDTSLTGDKNELTFIPDYELWDQLGCENDTCQRSQCRHENHCFQIKLRKDILQADILIVNHHILCADLAIKKESGSGSGLLPPYERLIIDESHHLEDIATIYFGSQASSFEVKRTLGLIARVDFKKKILKGGLLSRILRELPSEETSPGNLDGRTVGSDSKATQENSLRQTFYQQLNAFIDARIIFENFLPNALEKIFSYFDNSEEMISSEETRKEYKHRFDREEMDQPRWHELYWQPLEQILRHLQGLIDMLFLIENLLTRSSHPQNELPSYITELKAYRERLNYAMSNFEASLKISEPDEVRWIRTTRNKKQVYFATHISPLEIGSLLRRHLFTPLKTVILTSATLAGSGDDPFHHIKERLGMDLLDNLIEMQLSNDFDYAENCKMIVPPLPPVNTREFLPALTQELHHLLEVLRGRMLWLFTSYTMMRQVYQQLISPAIDLEVRLLIQGEEPRHELIRKLKESRNGVVLGVSSFWEGIDIKGERLSCLVMVKLPFAVPDEPILKSRLERLEAQGKNPFIDYSLPQAILRFKQGFGRLIRSPQDKGIFILFDNRIFNKGYGQAFIAALPNGLKPLPQVLEEVSLIDE